MVKKISVENLRLGMYICDTDRRWIDLPFMRMKFLLVSTKQIDTLKQYCKQVRIDTDKGLDDSGPMETMTQLVTAELDVMFAYDADFEVVELCNGELGLLKAVNSPDGSRSALHIMTDACKQLLPQAKLVELQALETQGVNINRRLDGNDPLAELLMALHARTKEAGN